MQYYVIGPDGQKFGPAEEALLEQWAAQGRISATTQLEHVETGIRVPAVDVVHLPPPVAPPPGSGVYAPPTGDPRQSYAGGFESAFSGQAAPYPVSPAQLGGWNWGAFVFTWIWGLNHKAYLTLLAFVPYVGFAVAIWAGIKGNQWAWESGRFRSIEEMQACQNVWRTWALIWFIGGISIAFLMGLLFPILFAGAVRH